jgi:hypothetical protein
MPDQTQAVHAELGQVLGHPEAFGLGSRVRGISVSWTVLHGQADKVLAARAAESKSSVILFGLHRSGNHMIDCADGVVSATIRRAHCPVMTFPHDLSR